MPRLLVIGVVATSFFVGCNLTGGVDSGQSRSDAGDGGIEAGDGAAEAGEGGLDGSRPPTGPMTMVAARIGLTTDRWCDLDGDGDGDNAIADLGEPMATAYVDTVNNLIQNPIEQAGEAGVRLLYHFPRVDELAGPSDEETVVIMLNGIDADHPDDPSDDYSGREAFFADANFLDGCGEPRYSSTIARIDHGELVVASARLSVPFGGAVLEMPDARTESHIEPYGEGFRGHSCGRVDVARLGGEPSFLDSGLTLLEELLAGGAAFGVPGFPGLSPDVDGDGDGLERFVLDASSMLEACIDGDATVIPGRDCWQDARIADGFALDIEMEGVSARLAGREPGWEHRIVGDCSAGPPEESLLDVPPPDGARCAGAGERCDPLLGEGACCDATHACAGPYGGAYRCGLRCDPLPCSFRLDSGEELTGTCRGQAPLEHEWGYCDPEPGSTPTRSCEEPGVVGQCDGGDFCGGERGDAHCYPHCHHEGPGCSDDYVCLPRRLDGGGVCVEPPPPATP